MTTIFEIRVQFLAEHPLTAADKRRMKSLDFVQWVLDALDGEARRLAEDTNLKTRIGLVKKRARS